VTYNYNWKKTVTWVPSAPHVTYNYNWKRKAVTWVPSAPHV